MDKYQGERLNLCFVAKDDEDHYIQDFSNYRLEAIITDAYGKIVKSWDNSTMDIGTTTIKGETAGYASFYLSGRETSAMQIGSYNYEMAYLANDDDRVIGVASGVINLKRAVIKDGIR